MSGRAREIPALLFALAWIAGFELGPAIHLARHASLAAHEHGAARAHCHDGVCHEDDRADAQDEGATPDHGAGSLEHGGLAALAPAALWAPIAGPLVAVIAVPWGPRGAHEAPFVARARARAPPRVG